MIVVEAVTRKGTDLDLNSTEPTTDRYLYAGTGTETILHPFCV
jgi:hypothetical protein